MGYGSQKFARGVDFDNWIDEVNEHVAEVQEHIEKAKEYADGVDIIHDRNDILRKAQAGNATILTVVIADSKTVELGSLYSGNGVVDWGDGSFSIEELGDSVSSHTYALAGEYNIKLYGELNLPISFSRLPITSVTIGNNVKSITDFAFSGCYTLKYVVIEDGVTQIGSKAFLECTSLQSVIIPDSVSAIGFGAFDTCQALKTVTFKGKTPPSGYDAWFHDCTNLEKIIVPIESINLYCSTFGTDPYMGYSTEAKLVDAQVFASDAWGTHGEVRTYSGCFKKQSTGLSQYTVTLADMSDSDAIFLTPVNLVDKQYAEEVGLHIRSSGNTLIFEYEGEPSDIFPEISFKYFIAKGQPIKTGM